MNKDEKDKLLKLLGEERNSLAEECLRTIAEEHGKIMGADFILSRISSYFRGEKDGEQSNS